METTRDDVITRRIRITNRDSMGEKGWTRNQLIAALKTLPKSARGIDVGGGMLTAYVNTDNG